VAKKETCIYDGILARPVQDELLLPGCFDEAPPAWFVRLGGSSELWKPLSKAIFEGHVKVARQIAARMSALCDHFGIDQSRSGWERDLASSLALRHAPWVFESPRVRLAELCGQLGIDPACTDHDLALNLARRHVPGFQMRPPNVDDWLYYQLHFVLPGLRSPEALTYKKLSTRDIVFLIFAAAVAGEHLKHTGGRVSDRRIAELILDPTFFRRSTPAFGRELAAIVQNRGNRKEGRRAHENRMSEKALREYLRQMRTAGKGNASGFQRRFLLDALPTAIALAKAMAIETPTSEPGQIAA
jgi:hypothetical protein